jgi:hypothetical protein
MTEPRPAATNVDFHNSNTARRAPGSVDATPKGFGG